MSSPLLNPPSSLSIGSRAIGRDHELFVIAEIGTSHQGDLDHARRLIDAAAEAGADCAKFQIVFADEIVHPRTGTVVLPGGSVALYDRFRELERDEGFYAKLKDYTEGAGLFFLASVFGLRSARILRALGGAAVKVASPELNHLPLLRELAGYDLPLILSTGVSLVTDIERAVQLLSGHPLSLMHCVTSYPAPPEDYNLRVMSVLGTLFGVPVGLSDHSLDPVLVPALGAALGAATLEKHLTLSRRGPGLDDPVALAPPEFRRMVDEAHRARREGIDPTAERLAAEYGTELVRAVVGSGAKRLAPSEQENYERTNRSIHALTELPAGALLTEENVAVLRTEKELRPGISPFSLDLVLGKRTVRAVPAGEGVRWEDLLTE